MNLIMVTGQSAQTFFNCQIILFQSDMRYSCQLKDGYIEDTFMTWIMNNFSS